MHCRKVRKKLSAWSDNETNRQLSGKIPDHLAQCPKCSRALQEMLNLRTLFRESTVPPLPEGFADSVMKQVRSLAANRPEAFQPLWWWRDFTFPLKAASTVAFGLVLSLGVYMGGSLTRKNPQTARASSGAASDAVISSMMQPFGETGAETIADAYLAITIADEWGR